MSAAGEMQGARIRLLDAADLAPGEMRRCVPPGHKALAVYNIGGEFFVTDDTCTHGMASLAEGHLEGDVIECPWHGGAFNVRTGQPAERPCIVALRTYAAVVEDGAVFINPGA